MQFHSDIRILSNGNSHRCIAQRAYPKLINKTAGTDRDGGELTRGSNAVVLAFVILVAFVGSGKIMFATELVFAVLTLERQEIDEVAVLS